MYLSFSVFLWFLSAFVLSWLSPMLPITSLQPHIHGFKPQNRSISMFHFQKKRNEFLILTSGLSHSGLYSFLKGRARVCHSCFETIFPQYCWFMYVYVQSKAGIVGGFAFHVFTVEGISMAVRICYNVNTANR